MPIANRTFEVLAYCTVMVVCFGLGCESPPPDNDPTGPTPSANESLKGVNDWAYQLQGAPALDLGVIGASAFDLVVIDYSAGGGEETEFTAAQIAGLKQSSGGQKIVLAYMSIGEAEIGRFYFDNGWVTPDPGSSGGPFTLTNDAPAFMAPPNPDFPDNFKVRYWDPNWQQIIINNPGNHPIIGNAKSYLDRIIEAGFDGVYLDIIGAFEFFGPAEIGGNGERADAASLMIDFVIAIANHARNTRGKTDFLVFPQNGPAIIDIDAFPPATVPAGMTQEQFVQQRKADYFAVIDGIGAEDSFYFGDAENDNPLDPQDFTIGLLDEFANGGLLVLAIDYVTTNAAIDDFYSRARMRSWVPYASIRDLSVLTINPTQKPD